MVIGRRASSTTSSWSVLRDFRRNFFDEANYGEFSNFVILIERRDFTKKKNFF